MMKKLNENEFIFFYLTIIILGYLLTMQAYLFDEKVNFRVKIVILGDGSHFERSVPYFKCE